VDRIAAATHHDWYRPRLNCSADPPRLPRGALHLKTKRSLDAHLRSAILVSGAVTETDFLFIGKLKRVDIFVVRAAPRK
jgi:hypothetical protein